MIDVPITAPLEGLCKYSRLCKKTNVCHNRTKCKASRCSRCRIHDCRRICPDFVKFDYVCPETEKAPFVCNGCSKFSRCDCFRFKYKATVAQSSYENRLRDTRAGIDMTADRLELLDQIVTPRIKRATHRKRSSEIIRDSRSRHEQSITMSIRASCPSKILTFLRRSFTSPV